MGTASEKRKKEAALVQKKRKNLRRRELLWYHTYKLVTTYSVKERSGSPEERETIFGNSFVFRRFPRLSTKSAQEI
jgi:hypothetical protein